MLHCRQLQNKEQGNTLEQIVDDGVRGWEQKTILDVHEQTVWTNNEGQDSPISHGCDTNYKDMILCSRTDEDDSALTLNGNNSVSGESHSLSLYSCRVCGTEGHLYQYCSQTFGIDKQEPDPHTLYPHMTCMPPHAIPQLSNRQSHPQIDNSDLQREVVRIIKTGGLVKRLNHHEIDDEQSTMQINKEIQGCVCCKVDLMLIAPMRKIQESPITPLKEIIQKEMLKNITVKWVRS